MNNIYMICNAHLDPVWQWRWQEGAAAAISTFRCAADFCEEFDGFVFNHNESLIYKWVEEYEPRLFERIKILVRQGKWKIMGGWYNQPDCNMPSGESFVRQILCGKNYFLEKFGVEPETAVNFDSFGHSRGLVQILKKSGYKNYMMCRVLEPGNYRWTGFDGSEIVLHRTVGNYCTNHGDAGYKIQLFVDAHRDSLPENALLTWGIGDHGGGPSRLDIADVNRKAAELKALGICVVHSDPDSYFSTVDLCSLPEIHSSIGPNSVGCYTSMVRIKQANRKLENRLYMAEKMLAHANLVYGTPYDKKAIEEAAEDMMFCQFHDILPGTMIEAAETDSLNRMGQGITKAEALQARAFFALSNGQPVAKEGEIPILVYNPHPYPVRTQIACEYQLGLQNWNYGEFTAGTVYHNGKKLPTQFEKEAGSIPLDWRKNVVFEAELEPLTMNRFDCKLQVERRRNWDIDRFKPVFELDNGEMHIRFDRETGLIEYYRVGDTQHLFANSGRLLVIEDNEDPWGMTVDEFSHVIGEFKLLSPKAAAEFIGYPQRKIRPFQIVEDGDVRRVYEGLFGYKNSFAVVRYYVPKQGTHIQIDIVLHMAETNTMVKYSLNTIAGTFLGQTAFGTDTLPMEGKAAVFQKFSAVRNEDAAFIVVNDGNYSGDYDRGVFDQVLLRTAAYTSHPLALTDKPQDILTPEEAASNMREHLPRNRYMKHMDMGMREFSFEFYGDRDIGLADYYAAVFNEKPFALSFFPCGHGSPCGNFMTIDNKAITMPAFKKACDDRGYIIRLYNSSDRKETVHIYITPLAMEREVTFGKFEVKTFRVDVEEKAFTETDLMEQSLK